MVAMPDNKLVFKVEGAAAPAADPNAQPAEATPPPSDPYVERYRNLQQTAPQQPAPAPGPSAPVVDESALRYFASKGDKARLEAEIARLRALYPNWTPPRDPLAVPQNADQQLERMWQLYSEARYADAVGVNLDKEMALLIQLQNAYAANARVITTSQAMWDALLASVR